jgi:hypothetical protein
LIPTQNAWQHEKRSACKEQEHVPSRNLRISGPLKIAMKSAPAKPNARPDCISLNLVPWLDESFMRNVGTERAKCRSREPPRHFGTEWLTAGDYPKWSEGVNSKIRIVSNLESGNV